MFKQAHVVAAVLAVAFLSGCDIAEGSTAPSNSTSVAMREDGGVYVVPVSVNGAVTVECVVDSGAADVNIPAEVFRKLQRAGVVQKSDFLGTEDYTLADGSTEPSRTFRIKSLKVGNITVHNVIASIGGNGSTALLGQSFLGRFRSWSLDNTHHTLVLLDLKAPVAPDTTVAGREPPAATGPTATGPATPSRADRGGAGPDGVSVAQTGGHASSDDDGEPQGTVAPRHAPDPDDGRLTAQQHSDSH